MSDEKGRDAEAAYFAKLDQENKQKLAAQVQAEREQAEREARKKLHAGHCGKCGGTLVPEVFRGVEIDVCAGCHSVLLDPGELQELAGPDESGVIATLAGLFGARRST